MPKTIASIVLAASMLVTGHSTASPATTTTVASTIAPTTTTTLVAPATMALWAKVAWCETNGNWKHEGRTYEGGLGILAWNWQHYGGTAYAPHAWLATPEQQVAIAIKIQHDLPVPDQNGNCAGW